MVGERGKVAFHVSTQVGVVRHCERHLHSDPPAAGELDALAAEVERAIAGAVPAASATGHRGGRRGRHRDVLRGASISAPEASTLEGHGCRGGARRMLGELAAIPLERRRRCPGSTPTGRRRSSRARPGADSRASGISTSTE